MEIIIIWFPIPHAFGFLFTAFTDEKTISCCYDVLSRPLRKELVDSIKDTDNDLILYSYVIYLTWLFKYPSCWVGWVIADILRPCRRMTTTNIYSTWDGISIIHSRWVVMVDVFHFKIMKAIRFQVLFKSCTRLNVQLFKCSTWVNIYILAYSNSGAILVKT